jgi:putative transposase
MKTFRYRIYPSAAQKKILNDSLFLCCRVYNECLARRKSEWEEHQTTLSAFDQMKEVQTWISDAPWAEAFPDAPPLDPLYAQVRNEVIVRLDKAFKAFFRRIKKGEVPGYPKFQPCRDYTSLTYTQSGFKLSLRDGSTLKNGSCFTDAMQVEGRFQHLTLGKIGTIKIRMHRPLQGQVKTCSIKRMPSGEWYAMLVCETEQTLLPANECQVGIDVGIEHLVTTSDGEHIANIQPLKKSLQALRKAQRRVSRRQRGAPGQPQSHRRKKAVRLVARIHGRVAEYRKDSAHKIAHQLVSDYGVIAAEALQIDNMVKNRHLSRAIHDAGWGQLLDITEAKATEKGRHFIRVIARGTSQECSSCGETVPKKLSERWHRCPHCGLELQRDINAARNILQRAKRELEAPNPQA